MTIHESINNITSLALALSILDGDVQKLSKKSVCERAGRRLSPSVLPGIDDMGKLAGILRGSGWPDELVPINSVNPEKPANLHEFLKGAVKMAISIGVQSKFKEQGAGAIYLHNPLHDELIMSAADGFPFVIEKDKPDWTIDFKSAYNTDKDKDEFDRNHARLAYLRRELCGRIADKNFARHDWIRYSLRGKYDDSVEPVDCNEDLIGIAYYKPGRGITGQLFDKDEAPKLERTRLSEPDPGGSGDSLAAAFETSLNKIVDNKEHLNRYLRDELLQKRTIVYKEREEMGAGRQVKAGQYEPLQFPIPKFIGPFLGTVLRFNGEHLGILKIERHKFRIADKEPLRQGSWLVKNPGNFTGEQTAHFLLFSYALSGYLYLLKHHAGIDLSEGWTKSV